MAENRIAEASCKKCGRSNPALRGLGVILTIRADEFQLLESFLLGLLDEVPCDGCNSGLGVSPTVLFISRDPALVLYSAGTQMLNERTALDQSLTQVVGELGPSTSRHGYPDHSALRGAIVKCLRSSLGPLKAFLEAKVNSSSREWLRTHVDGVGSSFFALAHIACTVPQIGLRAQQPDGTIPSRDELLKSFGEDQSASWLALLQAWAESNEERILEQDLERHIGSGFLLPGAVDRSIEIMGKLLVSQAWSPMVQYVGHAIVASLSAAADKENPYAADWTGRFFQLEMASALVDSPDERATAARLLVSAERAKRTVPFRAAWDTVITYIAERPSKKGTAQVTRPLDPKVYDALGRICDKAGYPAMLGQVGATTLVTGLDTKDLSTMLDMVGDLAGKITGNWELNDLITAIVRPLIEAGDHEGMIRVAERMIEKRKASDETRADIETWLGTQLKLMRKPLEFLERIGEEPGEWEFGLSANARVKLWTERSNALRILGRQNEALAIIEQVIRDLPPDIGVRNRRVALRNRAILLREVGMLDKAIQQLGDLTDDASGEELIETLDSLSVTQTHAGQYEAALANLDRALNIAKGPFVGLAPKLQAERALLLIIMDREREGAEELMTIGAATDPMTLISAASAWTNLLNSNYALSASEQDMFAEVAVAVGETVQHSRQFGDLQTYLGCLRLHAGMLEALGRDELAGKIYDEIYAECTELGQPRMYYELIALAARAFERGDKEQGRRHLLELPAAIAGEVGATANLWLASEGQTPKLRNRMAHLAAVVVKHADSFDDVRLISELQRDVIGRAQYMRLSGRDEIERLTFGVGAEQIASVANEQYPVAVLEWIAPAGSLGCFVSVISPDHRVKSAYLEKTTLDLEQLASKIRARLTNWYVGRPGDPFDFPEWKACEDWLVQQLSPHLSDDGHLVIIENQANTGIPWHVAGRHWTCSYAASWSSLLTLRKSSARAPVRIGQILVPKSFEGEEVETALRRSADRTRAYVTNRDFSLIEEVDSRQADRKRFEQIMQSATLAKWLCHGFIDPEQREIALLLAHEGELPLLSAASRSPAARAHRFTWEDCLALTSAPVAVFSAACSTGVSHIIGMGDRLGMFAGLRRAGTRAFVAPKWDAIAESVLPILDEALERYLAGEPIARAVHSVCKQAESDRPVWQAWNLMVEGDWDEHI